MTQEELWYTILDPKKKNKIHRKEKNKKKKKKQFVKLFMTKKLLQLSKARSWYNLDWRIVTSEVMAVNTSITVSEVRMVLCHLTVQYVLMGWTVPRNNWCKGRQTVWYKAQLLRFSKQNQVICNILTLHKASNKSGYVHTKIKRQAAETKTSFSSVILVVRKRQKSAIFLSFGTSILKKLHVYHYD